MFFFTVILNSFLISKIVLFKITEFLTKNKMKFICVNMYKTLEHLFVKKFIVCVTSFSFVLFYILDSSFIINNVLIKRKYFFLICISSFNCFCVKIKSWIFTFVWKNCTLIPLYLSPRDSAVYWVTPVAESG